MRVGAITLRFPNPGLLPWHDLNHVVTGFGTGLVGEAEVSAFELRAGWGSPMVLFLCLGSVAIGFLLAPRRILRAWKRSHGARSLYGSKLLLDDLLAMDLLTLRAQLGLPPAGIAD